MADYTPNLNLEKPLQSEGYDIDILNANADKIDNFAGQTPARALTADKLTTGAKINGVNFKGDTDIVTGAGFYYDTVTYGAGDLAFIYNQDDALELYKSLSAANIGHNPLTTTGYWEKQGLGGGGGSRNIGEIVSSTLPLVDAGLHLLDGTRLSGDGIYGDFVNYIAELYNSNPNANYFTTESVWQSSITNYGVCGKFVYNSTNNTVRLPKITGIVEGTTDLTALGDLVEAGLPNIKGNFGTDDAIGISLTGAFYQGANFDYDASSTGGNGKYIEFDASRSNSIYGDSSTVQPQTIKVLYYIVIATSSKTDIQVDIDEIATDLNGKAGTDLANVNNTGKILMAGMGMPSNRYIDLTLNANGSTYTAPANGYYNITWLSSNLNSVQMYNETAGNIMFVAAILPSGSCLCLVKKGDRIRVYYEGNGPARWFRFYYAQGSESEAQ